MYTDHSTDNLFYVANLCLLWCKINRKVYGSYLFKNILVGGLYDQYGWLLLSGPMELHSLIYNRIILWKLPLTTGSVTAGGIFIGGR